MRSHASSAARRLVATGLIGLTTLTLAGCQGSPRRLVNRPVAGGEPALKADIQPGVTVVEPDGTASVTRTAPSSTRMVTAMDRHPLLRKPRQYFDSTNSNKVVKTAAAAVVGVPAGIVGELRQIVVGSPSGEVTPGATTVY